jgi:outer membrane receptor for monomeric catechols
MDIDLRTKPGSADTSRVDEGGNSPENQAAVYSFVDLANNLEIFTGIRYVDELTNLNVDSYIAVDAGIRWSARGPLGISLSLENLNDARHVEFAPGKQIERSAFLRFRWDPE